MDQQAPPPIADLESIAAEKWLSAALAVARASVKTTPSADAVERMRMRIFGASEKVARKAA